MIALDKGSRFVVPLLCLLSVSLYGGTDRQGDGTTIALRKLFAQSKPITNLEQLRPFLDQQLYCGGHSATTEDEPLQGWVKLHDQGGSSFSSQWGEVHGKWVSEITFSFSSGGMQGPYPNTTGAGTCLASARLTSDGLLILEDTVSIPVPSRCSQSVTSRMFDAVAYNYCYLPDLKAAQLPNGDYRRLPTPTNVDKGVPAVKAPVRTESRSSERNYGTPTVFAPLGSHASETERAPATQRSKATAVAPKVKAPLKTPAKKPLRASSVHDLD